MSDEDLFRRAVMLVWESGNASTSFLQRRLEIGYNAAARLVERMESLAVVSKPNHVGKRTVRSPDDLRRALNIRDGVIDIVEGDEAKAAIMLKALVEGLRAVEPVTVGVDLATGPDQTITVNLTREQIEAMTKRKPDPAAPEFESVNNHNYAVSSDELRQFIERAEQLASEKKDIAEQEKELFAEAKGRGYDTKVMRKVIALRKRKPDDLAEEEAVLEMYKQALGMS